MIIRRLLVPLTVAVVALHAGHAAAQGAFPAPLPSQGVQQNDPAFPPVNGAAPSASVGSAPSSAFPSAGAAPVMGGGGAGFGPPPSPVLRSPIAQAIANKRFAAEALTGVSTAVSEAHRTLQETITLLRAVSRASSDD